MLWGRALVLARVAWIVLTVLTLGLDVLTIPAAYSVAQLPCADLSGASCGLQYPPDKLQAIVAAGIPLSVLAIYEIAVKTITALVYAGVGIVIFWRKSADRMAWFASLALVMFGGAVLDDTMNALAQINPAWLLPVNILAIIGQVSFVALFYLFPSGRFVPGWTVWVVLLWAAAWAAQLAPDTYFGVLGQFATNGPLFPVFIVGMVAAQLYRYMRVSNDTQRQQTKWVVFGLGMSMLGFLFALLLGNVLLPSSVAHSGWGTLFGTTIIYAFFLGIPISIGIAIMRSRLYDIDILINRTLVYGVLTGTLLLVYFGSVVLLQALLRPLTGQSNDLAIVASTLAIAALFNPLRRRIQGFIDRRFYRRKYVSEQVLAAFGETVRDEVDLDSLTGRLVAVVDETMRPAEISLWLRPTELEVQR
ncbi:MAG: hypothetical protein ACR2M0_00400 [Chloroflexia bacterium]